MNLPNHQKINNPKAFTILILILYTLLNCLHTKQIILMDSLQSKDEIVKMKLFEQLYQYVQTQRSISNNEYLCKSIFKNQLTKNQIQHIDDLNVQIDYPISILMQDSNFHTYTQEQTTKIRQIDQVINILKGKCLYYTTYTFLYQYCHKQHIRQFDNQTTLTQNAKPEYQDISMGIFHPQVYNKNKFKWDGPPKTIQEKKKTKPPKYDEILSRQYSMMNIQSLHNSQGQIQLQQSQNGQVLHSNIHLLRGQNYLNDGPLVLQLTCQQYSNNTRKQIINYALAATPFDLIYTLKNQKCHRLISYSDITVNYYYQSSYPLRIYGSYLYGNVQQMCTQNWRWQKNSQSIQFDNQLLQGSLIVLQGYDYQKNQLLRHYVTIKKIYNGDLIQLDTALGRSFYIAKQNYQYFSFNTLKSLGNFKNITKCQILFDKRLNIDKRLQKPIFYSNGFIKFNKQQTSIAQNNNIGCICRFPIASFQQIIDLDIQLGKTPFDNIYQSYISTKSNILQWKLFKKHIISACQNIFCYNFIQNNKADEAKSQKKQRKLRKFTQMLKLSKKRNRIYNITQKYLQKIYIINIKGKGILKLTTNTSQGQIYTYLISQGQIIKIRELQNGTKQIIKQNKYYQNSTQIPVQMRTKLKNGKYHGAIWKLLDFLYFPRFQLQNQILVSFQMIKNYAYIRILDPRQMVKEQSLAIYHYFQKIKQIYNKKSSQKEGQNTNNFNTSYKINYQYVSGKYCDLPVNAYRKTSVSLKCGPSWYAIRKIHEKSPCVYYVEIQTKLLCRYGFKNVVEDDQSILNGLSLSNKMLCHPKFGFYDQAFPIIYISSNYQSFQNVVQTKI